MATTTKLRSFTVYRIGANGANQPSAACPNRMEVGTVEATDQDQAHRKAQEAFCCYNNQHLEIVPTEEVEAQADEVRATIDEFVGSRPEGYRVKGQWYEPNGGMATWTPLEFISDETLDENLALDWESAEIDPDDWSLELFRHQGPVLSYFRASWAPDPAEGRRRIAYLGAHAGFLWEDDFYGSWHLEQLLDYCNTDESMDALGLDTIPDDLCGDDGHFWVVCDEARFSAIEAKCRELDESDADEEMDGEAIYEAVS